MNSRIKMGLLIAATIVLLGLAPNLHIVPMLNENQTLYFSSTLAQVSATLFGLTFTAYTFMENKLEKNAKDDDTLKEIIDELKLSYRYILIYGAIVTGLAIVFCVFNIMIGVVDDSDYSYNVFFAYILNASFIFSVASIIDSLVFAYKAVDPQKIKKKSKKLMKESISDESKMDNHFEEFIGLYNKLERGIIEYIETRKQADSRDERLTMYKAIDYLQKTDVISMGLCKELHHLRRIRNYIVHGDMLFVDKQTYTNLEKISKIVNDLIKEA